MKKKEWKRVVREMELNNNALAADIGQHKRDIASVWAIVGDEPGDSQDGSRYLPDVVQARMDELRRLRVLELSFNEREGDMHIRIRQGYDKTVADCWRAANTKLQAELDAMRPVVDAVCAYQDAVDTPHRNDTDEPCEACKSRNEAYNAMLAAVSAYRAEDDPAPDGVPQEIWDSTVFEDTGLPIRPGDVWRHPAFDDCVAVRDDRELGWQMLAGSGNVPIHMRDGTDWTFVRRGK